MSLFDLEVNEPGVPASDEAMLAMGFEKVAPGSWRKRGTSARPAGATFTVPKPAAAAVQAVPSDSAAQGPISPIPAGSRPVVGCESIHFDFPSYRDRLCLMVAARVAGVLPAGEGFESKSLIRLCNGLVRGVASDRPAPNAAAWAEARRLFEEGVRTDV